MAVTYRTYAIQKQEQRGCNLRDKGRKVRISFVADKCKNHYHASLNTNATAGRIAELRRCPLHGSRLRVKMSMSTDTELVPASSIENDEKQNWSPLKNIGRGARKMDGSTNVVVLGSGWGSIAFLKSLKDTSNYNVTVISPRNYFLYTPLLPGAATGAIEERSIVEPIRNMLARQNCQFYEATCLQIDPKRKKMVCRASDISSEEERGLSGSCPWHTFDVSYDILIMSVGAVPNTFGVPGVQEHAMFFKEATHADKFRREVTERFERAALPGTPLQRVKETLTFIIVGGGPTGVELAAELYDMVQDDIGRTYPPYLKDLVSIKIIDLMDFILSTYDRRIAEYATDYFRRNDIELLLNKQVIKVQDGVLILKDCKSEEEQLLAFGLCVWCTGIG